MKKKRGLIIITGLFLMAVVLVFSGNFCFSAERAGKKNLSNSYSVMHPDVETLKKWIRASENAPKAPLDKRLESQMRIASETSFSLLDYLKYMPSERNQGHCGNCWVWAGTGVTGIDLNVEKGVKDRLSVQFISSCSTSKSCCEGGTLFDFAAFYNSKRYMIPWANTNASWQNGDGACNVACSSIGTTPNYPVNSMAVQSIKTHGVEQATAIANIKNILHQNKAVWFGFYLPNSSDWNKFFDFWANYGENSVWNTDFSCGHTWVEGEGGGHAVLCVGYYDDGGSNRYWIMLNSWGTAGGNRPNGTFYLDMNINYDCYFLEGSDAYYSFVWQILAINWGKTIGINASVLSLWPVYNALCGITTTLWAQVKNTGASALPSSTSVWFWVDGPSWSGNHWVGSRSVAGLAANTTQWYSLEWTIPSDSRLGTYTYWAQVWRGSSAPISAWKGPQTFTVGRPNINIISLWPVEDARCGHSATLWAQVKNTGTSVLSSGTEVWFWVTGPYWSGDHWVGFASVAGLAANATQWYSLDWTIPSDSSLGTYTYWAQVWKGGRAISDWKGPEEFNVNCS